MCYILVKINFKLIVYIFIKIKCNLKLYITHLFKTLLASEQLDIIENKPLITTKLIFD